jgi:hypothetical protein
MPEFRASTYEFDLIAKIARRAHDELPPTRRSVSFWMMDIEACHSNGMPLKLDELLKADRYNFAHDLVGIYNHLDRVTGQLGDCFVPRYALDQVSA